MRFQDLNIDLKVCKIIRITLRNTYQDETITAFKTDFFIKYSANYVGGNYEIRTVSESGWTFNPEANIFKSL